MFTPIYGRLIHFISAISYLVLFLVVLFLSRYFVADQTAVMAILAILSLVWALLLYRRVRIIEDTPNTLLHSAAQGYVELEGKVSLYENEIVRGLHFELPPMVWYDYLFQSSGAGFILDDGNGRCTIDPAEAEVITPLYQYNNRHYHAIYPGETIYVLGQLETLKKHKTEYERDGLIRSKVIQWKKNQTSFLDYFDTNKDGKIDDAEMDFAKHAAANEVDHEVEASYQKPATHVVSRPTGKRPFILSSIHPDDLLRRYKRAIVFHLMAWLYLSVLVLVA